jgi:hypothetical protein
MYLYKVIQYVTLLNGKNSPPHAAAAPTIIGANLPNVLHSDTPALLLTVLLVAALVHTLAAADTNVHSALALKICDDCILHQHCNGEYM